jgi:hypothetical protein
MPICLYCDADHMSAYYCAAMYLRVADQVEAVPDACIGPILRAHRAALATALRAWSKRTGESRAHTVLDTARFCYGLSLSWT